MVADTSTAATRPAVVLDRVAVAVGGFALRDIDIVLAPGEIGVILGPNGAGKSVTLETIAGFYRPRSGRIRLRGRDVTDLAPEARRVGFIFQNFGLFPHLNVIRNIAFGRRPQGAGGMTARRIAELLERFGLQPLAHRMPGDLSPGEKQRVALARSLLTQPDVFLFDEPFSALDSQTRDRLRDELKVLLRETRIAAIFVTHDHQDARVLADQLAVMQAGRIVQTGAPDAVFTRPANRFVAGFLGVDNVLEGRVVSRAGSACQVALADASLQGTVGDNTIATGDRVYLCIRAENITLGMTGAPDSGGTNNLPGSVVGSRRLGPLTRVTVDCGVVLSAYVLDRSVSHLSLAPGIPVTAQIDVAAVHVIAARPGPTTEIAAR